MTYIVSIFEPYIETTPVIKPDDVVVVECSFSNQVLRRRLLSGFHATKKRVVGDAYEFLVNGEKIRVNKEFCKVRKVEDGAEVNNEPKPKGKKKK